MLATRPVAAWAPCIIHLQFCVNGSLIWRNCKKWKTFLKLKQKQGLKMLMVSKNEPEIADMVLEGKKNNLHYYYIRR